MGHPLFIFCIRGPKFIIYSLPAFGRQARRLRRGAFGPAPTARLRRWPFGPAPQAGWPFGPATQAGARAHVPWNPLTFFNPVALPLGIPLETPHWNSVVARGSPW